jgi:hypothetical protein
MLPRSLGGETPRVDWPQGYTLVAGHTENPMDGGVLKSKNYKGEFSLISHTEII